MMMNLVLILIAAFVIWHVGKLSTMVYFMGRTEAPQAICKQQITKFEMICALSTVSDNIHQSNTIAVETQNCKTIDNNGE